MVNNSSFRYYYRNNIDTCSFEPTCDKREELSYVQMNSNLFDTAISHFINYHLFQEKKEEDYEKILDKKDDKEIRFELLKQPILIKKQEGKTESVNDMTRKSDEELRGEF